MRKTTLNAYEKSIEKDLLAGVYVPVKQKELHEISESIAYRKKDAVLNIRVNSHDLESIKSKARKMGIKYQTLISEVLHKVAL
ncbi:MAG: hypothetical protein NTU66_07205 [Elusimicrobia bacterium]|nr:hypothetical protein [Elusimicrobiota bacterium]